MAGLLNLGIVTLAWTSSRLAQRRIVLAILVVVGVFGSIAVVTLPMGQPTGALGASAQAAVLLGAIASIVDRIARHEDVSLQTLLGAIAAYLLVGQAFAWAYLTLPGYFDDQVISPAVAGEVPMYYSYVVLTTLGFGDVTPTGGVAERVTVLEALTGQLFVGVLIARLVSSWSRPNPPETVTAVPPDEEPSNAE